MTTVPALRAACGAAMHARSPVSDALSERRVPGHLGDFELVVVAGEAADARDSPGLSPVERRPRRAACHLPATSCLRCAVLLA